uniref:Uncharacterized protein n=1 Tax=Parascaris equorum TaxID=6256 RepID=A0A914RKC4_PAREQ
MICLSDLFRLAQMAKNKLSIQNPKALLAEMYVLVMGDEADDVEDVSLLFSSLKLPPAEIIERSRIHDLYSYTLPIGVREKREGRGKELLKSFLAIVMWLWFRM